MPLPPAVPEIPVDSVDRAVGYYVGRLGFALDWGDEAGGIAGISRGACRLFLTSTAFRGAQSRGGPVVIWLNLGSRAEVDGLFGSWAASGAEIVSAPEDKPWKLREFTAADVDGNRLRVFYDFSRDE